MHGLRAIPETGPLTHIEWDPNGIKFAVGELKGLVCLRAPAPLLPSGVL